MNILHLSDIHFGRNFPRYRIKDSFERHDEILDELLELLAGLDDSKKPEHIVFTGDIAWRGQKDEFDEALVFFRRLLDAVGLTGKNISFCVGNHDIERNYRCIGMQLSNDTGILNDEFYRYEHIHLFEPVIYRYNEFCRALGVEPYAYPVDGEREYSYTAGYKDVCCRDGSTLRIVSFNTSMLACQKVSSDKLWLGKTQIEALEEYGIIPAPAGIDYTMSLFHHSDRFLHPDETSTYEGRQAPLPILMDETDLLLCGHTESSGKPRLTQQHGGGQMLMGGATYYCDTHQNAFSMLYISPEDKGLWIAPYIYSDGWKAYDFMEKLTRRSATKLMPPAGNSYHNLKLICRGEAERVIPVRDMEELDGRLTNRKDFMSCFAIDYDGKLSVALRGKLSRDLDAITQYREFCGAAYDSFELLTEDGAVLFRTDRAEIGPAPDYEETLLQQLRAISEFYNVKLTLPEKLSEDDFRSISFLHRLAAEGMEVHESDSGDRTVTVDRAKLEEIWEKAQTQNNRLFLLRDEPYQVRLLRVDLTLRNTAHIRGPYHLDLDDVRFKLESFREGDTRTVTFYAEPDNKTFFFLNKEGHKDYSEEFENSVITI